MYINFGILEYTFSCRIASTIFLTTYSDSRIGSREGQLGSKKDKDKNKNNEN